MSNKEHANSRCDGSADGGTPTNHVGRGGSIPASSLFFHVGESEEANRLIMTHHYSRRVPGSVQFVGTLWTSGGLFGTKGECVAACTFSSPPTRWSEPVLELSRLVRGENKVPLTLLICMSVKAIKKAVLADLLVSFADRTQGHEGYIYRAANWNYGGCRDRAMDGLIVGGQFVPGRTCNATWGTRSPQRLMERHGINSEPHYDEGKHLYWLPLNRSGKERASRLGLKIESYG